MLILSTDEHPSHLDLYAETNYCGIRAGDPGPYPIHKNYCLFQYKTLISIRIKPTFLSI